MSGSGKYPHKLSGNLKGNWELKGQTFNLKGSVKFPKDQRVPVQENLQLEEHRPFS